jgi:hypothetical protein
VSDRNYPRCDRAFDAAIERGFLTVQQAIERGDRAHYAAALQQKYGLAMDRAFQVTDNMMSLAEALAEQTGVLPVEVTDPSGTHWIWSTVQVSVALVVIAAGTYAVFRQKERPTELVLNTVATRAPSSPRRALPSDPPAAPKELVAFQTGPEGRVTEITGPDPKTVLLRLCQHPQFAETLSPIALAPAFPPSTGARLGLIRDVADPERPRCVAIHRDSRSGRWSAGNGLEPLEIQLAPKLPPETILTPL